jgi:hypothetical protein
MDEKMSIVRMINDGETKMLTENLLQCHFAHSNAQHGLA